MPARSFRKIYNKLMDPVFTTVRGDPLNEKYRPKLGQLDHIFYKQRSPIVQRLGRALVIGVMTVRTEDWVTEEFAQYDAEVPAKELKKALRKASKHPLGRYQIITYLWTYRTLSIEKLKEIRVADNSSITEEDYNRAFDKR